MTLWDSTRYCSSTGRRAWHPLTTSEKAAGSNRGRQANHCSAKANPVAEVCRFNERLVGECKLMSSPLICSRVGICMHTTDPYPQHTVRVAWGVRRARSFLERALHLVVCSFRLPVQVCALHEVPGRNGVGVSG